MSSYSHFGLESKHIILYDNQLKNVSNKRCVKCLLELGGVYDVHWKDYEKDLTEVSKLLPKGDYIQVVRKTDEGEFFRSVFMNGKFETVKGEIIYPFIQWEQFYE